MSPLHARRCRGVRRAKFSSNFAMNWAVLHVRLCVMLICTFGCEALLITHRRTHTPLRRTHTPLRRTRTHRRAIDRLHHLRHNHNARRDQGTPGPTRRLTTRRTRRALPSTGWPQQVGCQSRHLRRQGAHFRTRNTPRPSTHRCARLVRAPHRSHFVTDCMFVRGQMC
jgi:hypothetical protein